MCFDDDTLLSSTLTSVLIPSFDIKLQQPIFFSSWKVFMPFLPSNIYQLKQGHAFSLPKLTGLDSWVFSLVSLCNCILSQVMLASLIFFRYYCACWHFGQCGSWDQDDQLHAFSSLFLKSSPSIQHGEPGWLFQAKEDPLLDAQLKFVCRATSAAPTFFPPVQFHVKTKNPPAYRDYNLVDGGIAVNNPVRILIQHSNSWILFIF